MVSVSLLYQAKNKELKKNLSLPFPTESSLLWSLWKG